MNAQQIDILRGIRAMLNQILSSHEGILSSEEEVESCDAPESLEEVLGRLACEEMANNRQSNAGMVDPNSIRQRAFRTMREYLSIHGTAPCREVFAHVEKVTGLSSAQVKRNCRQCEGIRRQFGQWSLKDQTPVCLEAAAE